MQSPTYTSSNVTPVMIGSSIDVSNTPDVNISMENFSHATSDEWSVDMQSLFITSTPSDVPTFIPSLTPSTLIPSATPSITGLVVTIDVTS